MIFPDADDPAVLPMHLGTRIALYRSIKGLSPAMLADRASISFGYLQSYETGELIPPLTILARIATALCTDAETLANRAEGALANCEREETLLALDALLRATDKRKLDLKLARMTSIKSDWDTLKRVLFRPKGQSELACAVLIHVATLITVFQIGDIWRTPQSPVYSTASASKIDEVAKINDDPTANCMRLGPVLSYHSPLHARDNDPLDAAPKEKVWSFGGMQLWSRKTATSMKVAACYIPQWRLRTT